MSVFPIIVRKVTMKHRTHEKDYHQVLICTNDDRSLVINRWGKRGAKGQLEFNRHADPASAVAGFETKQSTKRRDGYVHESSADKIFETHDEAELRKAIGLLYWGEMKSELEWLVPGIDTAGAKDPDLPTWAEEDGKLVHKGYQPKHKFIEAEPTVEDQIADNANWGMF